MRRDEFRRLEAFAGAFSPGSLAIPLEMIPAYAGYPLDYEHDLVLVAENHEQISNAVVYLLRMGFDRVAGYYLKSGMTAWEVSGRRYDRIGAAHAAELDRRLRAKEDFTLLDVRKIGEFEQQRLAGATHIFLGDLPERVDELDRSRPRARRGIISPQAVHLTSAPTTRNTNATRPEIRSSFP